MNALAITVKASLFHRYRIFPIRTEINASLFYQKAFVDFGISPTEMSRGTLVENFFSADEQTSAFAVEMLFEAQGVNIQAFTISECKSMFLFAHDTPEAVKVLTQMKLMYA